ncbi:hypothetical protein DAI22_12g117900 [Oryza sativa Japonica Group]|nr:hypothetical protein DAI22_12g117900 [Oryza sativa Japonica Group]
MHFQIKYFSSSAWCLIQAFPTPRYIIPLRPPPQETLPTAMATNWRRGSVL